MLLHTFANTVLAFSNFNNSCVLQLNHKVMADIGYSYTISIHSLIFF